jgi:hypothetical protein
MTEFGELDRTGKKAVAVYFEVESRNSSGRTE